MPTINKRFLLKSALFLMVFVGVLTGAHTIQSRRIPDSLRRQADHASEHGNADKSIHYLRRYLEFVPNDIEALERLADAVKARMNKSLVPRDTSGDKRELVLLYDRILRLDQNRSRIRKEALKECLDFGRAGDAETHAEWLLRESPANADLWRQLASAQARLQKNDEARVSYETAIKHDPDNVLGYQQLAQFLWRDLKKPIEAKEVLDRMVIAAPKKAEAWLSRAKLVLLAEELSRNSDPSQRAAQAFPDLRKSLELEPENAEALLMIADQHQVLHQFSEAKDAFVKGIHGHPADMRFVRGLAWLELNRGNLGAAVTVLEDGMVRADDASELLVPMADLLVQLGDTTRSEQILKKVEAKRSRESRLQVLYLKARLAMHACRWIEAIVILSTLRTESSNLPGLEHQTNWLLSICHRSRGDVESEQDILKLLLNQDPNHVAGRVALATSYLDSGRTVEAIREYELAAKLPFAGPVVQSAWLRLKAREHYIPGSRRMDPTVLERATDELAKAYHPSSSEPILLLAELASARGDAGRIVTLLRSELTTHPGDPRLWVALAEAVADVAGVDSALGIMNEAQAVLGDGPDVRLERASLYVRDPAHLRPIEPLTFGIDSWSDSEQTRLLYGLVEIYDRLGDEARVVRTYRRVAARSPGDIAVWRVLGERAAHFGDMNAFREAREAAVRLDGEGKAEALFNSWTSLAGDRDTQRRAIDALVAAYGPEPELMEACLSLARLKKALGENEAYGKLIERAVRLEPSRIPPMAALLAHVASADDEKSNEALKNLLIRLTVDYRWTSRYAVDCLWAGQAFRRVIVAAAQLLPRERAGKLMTAAGKFVGDEPEGIAWLGDVYRTIGLKENAVQCYERAVADAHAVPDDWMRLALARAESNGPEAGAAVMADARQKLSAKLYFPTAAAFAETPSAPPGWQPTFDAAADKKLHAQARLALKLSRGMRTEGIAVLEKYLGDGSVSESDSIWAKRQLAMLLAAGGSGEDRKKAVALLMNSEDRSGDTVEDKRAAAAVLHSLASRLEGADRKAVLARATKALEELVAETRQPRDAFLLSQVYRTAGNRVASVRVLNELNKADPKNLEFHLRALEDLTEMGDFRIAQSFADRLKALHGDDFRVVQGLARYECRAGRPEKAIVLADGYIRTADSGKGDLATKSVRAAELLDELMRTPNVRNTPSAKKMAAFAVEKYEELIPTRPEAVIAASGVLATDGKADEAFALIEKHTVRLTPRLKAAAGMAILRAGGEVSERRFAQVGSWLESARADDPESTALELALGEFHSIRKDDKQAEIAYRQVLTREPRNVVALNNLAWILAPNPDSAPAALELLDRAIAEAGVTGELLDTRARIRIASRQFEVAEKDLLEALSREKTPLRMFHMAMAKDGLSPDRKDEVRDAFRKAKEIGLDTKTIHPVDLPVYRAFDADAGRAVPR